MADELTPKEALARIAEVAHRESFLQARVEGLAWIVWGLVLCLQMLHSNLAPAQPLASIPALVWHLVGIGTSVGIWRASGLDLDTRHATRALLFFIGMPIFVGIALEIHLHIITNAGAIVVLAAIILAIVLAVALGRPTGSTPMAKLTGLALAGFATFLGIVALVTPVEPSTLGSLIGVSWMFAGILALFSG